MLVSGLVYTVSANTVTNSTTPTQQADNDDIQEEVESQNEADDGVEDTTPEQPEAAEAPETEGAPETDSVEEQNPSYTASIAAPHDATDDQLNALTKITPEDAAAAALKDSALVGGTVNKVELDDENGNLVYSVEINIGSIEYDAKVDAGTSVLLYIDQ